MFSSEAQLHLRKNIPESSRIWKNTLLKKQPYSPKNMRTYSIAKCYFMNAC